MMTNLDPSVRVVYFCVISHFYDQIHKSSKRAERVGIAGACREYNVTR